MRLALPLVSILLLGALIPPASARGVKKPLVTVLASGSTDTWTGSVQHFGYGVVLRNTSTTRDVLGVKVHVAVLSRNGAVIGIYLTSVPRIPAGWTFYLGNEPVTIGNTQHAASIVVGVAVSATQAPHGSLPVGHAHVSGTHVVGSVQNVSSRTLLGAGTRIFAVYYDAAGRVIGGTRLQHLRFAKHNVPAHTSGAFTAGPGAAVGVARIARVRVSVVPGF